MKTIERSVECGAMIVLLLRCTFWAQCDRYTQYGRSEEERTEDGKTWREKEISRNASATKRKPLPKSYILKCRTSIRFERPYALANSISRSISIYFIDSFSAISSNTCCFLPCLSLSSSILRLSTSTRARLEQSKLLSVFDCCCFDAAFVFLGRMWILCFFAEPRDSFVRPSPSRKSFSAADFCLCVQSVIIERHISFALLFHFANLLACAVSSTPRRLTCSRAAPRRPKSARSWLSERSRACNATHTPH